MAAHPDFLTRLGLDEGADEREVKRAYARELKRIDQERDLDGFQHLRACYEAALTWTGRGAAPADAMAPVRAEPTHAEPAAPAVPPVPAADLPASPAQTLAAAVFGDFVAATAELGCRPDVPDDAVRSGPWADALRTALADARLTNVDARAEFEAFVAVLLVRGWRPGHPDLLAAADEVFGWSAEPQALARLGEPGRVLNQALDQCAMFKAQGLRMRNAQRAALAALRVSPPLDERSMRLHMRAVRMLAERFPDLLRILADEAAVADWLRRCPPPEAQPPRPVSGPPPRVLEWKGTQLFSGGALAVFLVVRLFTSFGKPWHEPERTHPVRPMAALLADEQLQAIHAHLDYRPGLRTRLLGDGFQVVKLLVTLDTGGMVSGVDVVFPASDADYTEAVEKAVRATAPFPPETPRRATVVMSDMRR